MTLQIDTRKSNGAPDLRRWLAERTESERATLARLWALPEDTRPDPAALAAVLMKCLARDPADRYPDAAAMRKALRPFC